MFEVTVHTHTSKTEGQIGLNIDVHFGVYALIYTSLANTINRAHAQDTSKQSTDLRTACKPGGRSTKHGRPSTLFAHHSSTLFAHRHQGKQ